MTYFALLKVNSDFPESFWKFSVTIIIRPVNVTVNDFGGINPVSYTHLWDVRWQRKISVKQMW